MICGKKKQKRNCGASCAEIDTTCRAGIYVRLSVEDKHTRTASIETQQLIIADIWSRTRKSSWFKPTLTTVQRVQIFTGPASSRCSPILKRALSTVSLSKIFPAWGRNVIDTGYYIERYFPTQGVRFIAVNDRYDSSSPDHAHDGIIIPLRNMINEAYALDIAKKIKAQQRQAMKDGKYVRRADTLWIFESPR